MGASTDVYGDVIGEGESSDGPGMSREVEAHNVIWKEDRETCKDEEHDSRTSLENRYGYGNLSSLNKTSLEMYILPLGERHIYPLWDVE